MKTGAKTIRRRLAAFAPVVMFVVLVQVLAPVSAFRFVANAVSDPLFLATVCDNSGDIGAATSDLSHRHGGCCTVCATGLGAAASADAPIDVVVVLQRRYQRVVWLAAQDDLPVLRPGSNAQARAPPYFS
jgi:hypothetical protein